MHIPETIHLSGWILYAAVIFYFLVIITSVVVVLLENRNPIRALSWVIALIFLPGIGLIFYLFFGRSMRGEMLSQANRRRLHNSVDTAGVKLQSTNLSKEQKNLIILGSQVGGYPLTYNNDLIIFTD